MKYLRKRGWGIHVAFPWSEDVRENGAPLRAYIQTPWGWLIAGEQSQVYDLRAKQYTDRWSYVTYRPVGR